MSKRSTTGLPKPDQPKPEADAPKSRLQPKLLHEYRSKHERETEIQRLVILGTAAAVGIAVLILLGSILNEALLVPNQSVANVNGTTITVAQFKTRARIERTLLIQQLNNAISLFQGFGYTSDQLSQVLTSQQPYSTWYGELSVPDQLGNSVLNTMVEDELIRQKAQSLNLSVSEADIDAQIKKLFGYDPATANLTPTPTTAPTLTPTPLVSPTPSPMPTATPIPAATTEVTEAADVTPTTTPLPSATPTSTPNATEEATQVQKAQDDFFANMRSTAGVGDSDIREYFRALALREKVRDAEITDITHTAPFIDARHILVADETTANTVLAALKAGESFASLAKSMSSDNSASGGGELGWAPTTNYVKEFADAAKTAEIGALVGPVKSQFGYHIIQVRAREDRPLTDSDYQTALNNEFATYLKNLRADPSTNVQIFDAWTDNVPTTPQWVPNF